MSTEQPTEIKHHHDGHGLNDLTVIEADARDPQAGNASHLYTITRLDLDGDDDDLLDPPALARIQFQHGATSLESSTPGILDGAVLAVLIDRYESFQSHPTFACSENKFVLHHLREAMRMIKHRADIRARQRVLGTNQAHVSGR